MDTLDDVDTDDEVEIELEVDTLDDVDTDDDVEIELEVETLDDVDTDDDVDTELEVDTLKENGKNVIKHLNSIFLKTQGNSGCYRS